MAIAFVNAGSAWDTGGTGTANLATGTFAMVAGNLMVVFFRNGGGQAPMIGTLSDTAGNTYTQLGNIDGRIEMWYAKNIIGIASGTILAQGTAPTGNLGLVYAQYSGLSVLSPLDQIGSTNTPAGGTAITQNVIPIFSN